VPSRGPAAGSGARTHETSLAVRRRRATVARTRYIQARSCESPSVTAAPTDEQLLASSGRDAFAMFYDRHAGSVLAYFARRTRDPEAAADLTAETFAAAIVARRRFRPGPEPASAWLFGIAHHKLADFQRRGRAEDRALRRLRVERPRLDEEDARLVALMADEVSVQLLSQLPEDERYAIQAHVVEGREYAEIAAAAVISEPAARMRVSRGLGRLRARIGGHR
jgi:RNA polymerase sigma factor (sigma-70 family)